jgi:PKD repeat protein
MTFNPATPGSVIRATFESFSTESGYDYLRIYDGTSTSAPLIGSYNGTTGPGTITATNAAGALTFNFTSDVSVTPDGWEASISCYSITVPPVADFSASPVNAMVDQAVTFTDLSTNVPGSWLWSITPGTFSWTGGTDATSQNPQVLFSATGQYTVSLIATNNYGSDTETKTNYITVHNCTINAFPWTEGFENGGQIPSCWTQEQVNSSGLNWTFITGNGSSYPATAHTGTYNACLKDNSSDDHKTMLITPALDLSSLPNPQLKFWHTQAYWSPDQDILTVYYKTSQGGPWNLLATYTSDITTWTQETLALPSSPGTCYIAFEGNAKYGRGVCVDDVEVSTSCATVYPVSISIAASANPVEAGIPVTFTAAATNEGSAPSYQWKRNNENIGDNTATCIFVPADGDAVQCILTSNLTCAMGNPATSNVITMTVQSVPATLSINDVTVTGTECFDAIQTIMVAGNNDYFMVQPGGSATMIAGQNILYYPGTTIVAGGYLYGYIAPAGPWCSNPAKEVIIAGQVSQNVSAGQNFFSVYPNPTTGDFTLKLSGISTSEPVTVELYSMKGEKISTVVMTHETTHKFSISGKPAGLYLVRVIARNLNGVSWVVKQ